MSKEVSEEIYDLMRKRLEARVGKNRSDFFFYNVIYALHPDKLILHDKDMTEVPITKGKVIDIMVKCLEDAEVDMGEDYK